MTTPAPIRIGIDLGGTKIEALALDRAGAVRFRERIATPPDPYANTIVAITSLVRAAEAATGSSAANGTATVGVGIPGTISPATGLVKNANSVRLIGHPLDRDLAAAVGAPVRLGNDADCFALSEASDGAGAGAKNVFGIILGTGVGGGLVIDGRVVGGPNAIAGEWGHNPLPWPTVAEMSGPSCYCGRRGCIETFLSGPALRCDHPAQLSPPDIIAAAEHGDPVAVATLDRYVERLARALASVINIVDPHVIVVGGGLSNVARIYTDVPRLWGRHVFSDTVATKLLPPMHGDASGVRGAAWLWP